MANNEYIELSPPGLPSDGLRFLTIGSAALGGRGDVTLFVPRGTESLSSLPLVLLLHGVYASHWAWALNGQAHLTAAQLIDEDRMPPAVLVMPSDGLFGEGSGYVAHAPADYEKWIVEDVIGCVVKVLPCLSPESPLFIAGLSMGGFGALRLGAKYAARFRGISAHSAITHLDQMALFVAEAAETFGAMDEEKKDALYWLRHNRKILPPLRFDCGTGDLLIEENRTLHRRLTESGIPHQYFEFAGGHSWDYWREHLVDTLLFFAAQMK